MIPLALRLLTFATVVSIASASDVSLKLCVYNALQKDPGLLSAKQKIAEFEARIGETSAQRLPTLNLSASALHNGDVTVTKLGSSKFQFQPENSYRIGLTASQLLYDFGRSQAIREAAKLSANISQYEHDQLSVRLQHAISAAYWRWVLLQNQVAQSEQIVKSAEQNAELAQQKYARGMIASIEVSRLKLQLSQARAQLVVYQMECKKARQLVSELSLLDSDSIACVEQMSVWVEQLLKSGDKSAQPKLTFEQMIAQERAQLTKQNLRTAKSGRYPTFMSTGSLTWANGSDPFHPDELNRQWNVGVTMTFPVFDGYATSYRVISSTHSVRQSEFNQLAIEKRLQTDINQAEIQFREAVVKFDAQQKVVEQADAMMITARAQFEAGQTSSRDVMDAVDALNSARLQLLMAGFELISTDNSKRAVLGISPRLSWEMVP